MKHGSPTGKSTQVGFYQPCSSALSSHCQFVRLQDSLFLQFADGENDEANPKILPPLRLTGPDRRPGRPALRYSLAIYCGQETACGAGNWLTGGRYACPSVGRLPQIDRQLSPRCRSWGGALYYTFVRRNRPAAPPPRGGGYILVNPVNFLDSDSFFTGKPHSTGSAAGAGDQAKERIMRTETLRILVAAVVVLASVGLSQAKESRGGKSAKQHPRRAEVNGKLRNQQSRINQGVKSGELNQGQAKQLEANDKHIKQQEVGDVKADGGHLSKAEQHQLNQESHANSTLIHDEKHPKTATNGGSGSVGSGSVGSASVGSASVGSGEVNRRLARQQSRVNKGVKSGELNQGQAQQLEANDSAVKQQESTDRKAKGGSLTKAEKRQINQEENANSTLIHDEKHPAK